ncbi:phosphoinositide 3-kinase regulatory subunit 6 isoform 1-T2 [Pholidichthys leucotaenia]
MARSTADVGLPCTLEPNLCDDVQALFSYMSIQSSSMKGMLIWTLQKKVVANPSCSIPLFTVLLTELEKMYENQSYTSLIQVLHTLSYVVIQSGVKIPDSLYQRMYQCLMRLLTLPVPYCSVALRTLRNIKTEMITPGSLYLKRVIAEQNLKNLYFPLQEKVFVLADPALFSPPLEATVRAYLNVSSSLRGKCSIEKNVLLHVLQKGLEMTSQSSKLAQSIEEFGDHDANLLFLELVLAVKFSISHGTGGQEDYLKTLQNLYEDILAPAEEGFSEMAGSIHGSRNNTALPFPEINFHLWKDEDTLWELLQNFTHSCCSSMKDKEKNTRDSGIVKDIAETPPPSTNKSVFKRRHAYKKSSSSDKLSLMKEKMERVPERSPLLKEEQKHTARVVVMGDNRVLGQLTQAYYSIRKKESKHLWLTKKVNLQFYYIPVSDEASSSNTPESLCKDEGRLSLASFLGQVDPWYNSNIRNLGSAIPTLPEMPSNQSVPSELNLFLLDTLCYYLRCATQPVNLPLYSVEMTCSSSAEKPVVRDVFVSQLEADIPEFRHLKETCPKNISRRKKTSVQVFGAVISVRYTKNSLSKRGVVQGAVPMACGVVVTSVPRGSSLGDDCLGVSFDSLNPEFKTKIQTRSISIRAMENRTLAVCLDKDSRRTYTDVQKIEICPCLDPGCRIWSSFSNSTERELPLNKYLDKVLSLPINTFTGVTI